VNSLKPKAVENLLRKAAESLKGNSRRTFMAQTIEAYGPGGQNWADENLRWNRGTIRKGQQELNSGIPADESFSSRGRKKAEEHFPNLLADIKAIVEPKCQTDPTFHTTRLYRPITAKAARDLLIEDYGYDPATMPHLRTISRKLDVLEYWPRKVTKSKPLKKIPETNDIFNQVYTINRDADENPGVLRISLDAKARIKVGPFSRGGYSRQHKEGLDHDLGFSVFSSPSMTIPTSSSQRARSRQTLLSIPLNPFGYNSKKLTKSTRWFSTWIMAPRTTAIEPSSSNVS